jgi:hypothetical protein
MPTQEQVGLQKVLDAIRDWLDASENVEGPLTARIADLLLAYVGPSSPNGVRNGAESKLRQVADAVKETFKGRAGSFSNVKYLRDLRSTAEKFPPTERSVGVPFSWMIVARDPETLRAATKQADRDRIRCSAEFIRKYRAGLDDGLDDPNPDDGEGLVWLRELERRLVEDPRYYLRSAQRLGVDAGPLLRAFEQFSLSVKAAQVPLREAAE